MNKEQIDKLLDEADKWVPLLYVLTWHIRAYAQIQYSEILLGIPPHYNIMTPEQIIRFEDLFFFRNNEKNKWMKWFEDQGKLNNDEG